MNHISLLLAVLVLILRPQEFIPGWESFPLLQVVFLLAVLPWVTSAQKQLVPQQSSYGLLFVIATMLSVGFSGWWGGMLPALLAIGPSIAVYLLAASGVRNDREFRNLSLALMAIASALVYHGWQQRTYGFGWTGTAPVEGNRIRYIGLLNDPNDLGLVLCLALVAAGYLAVASKNFLARVLSSASALWIAYGIYMTNSRGALLAAAGMVLSASAMKFGLKKAGLLAVLTVPLLLGVGRLQEIDADEESAEGRLEAWYEGIQLFREHPLLGIGYGNFWDYHELTAHNSLVLVLAETGIVGYVLWFAFVGASATLAYKSIKRTSKAGGGMSSSNRAEAIALMCIAFAIGAFFLSQSYKPFIALICGLATGTSEAIRIEAGEPVDRNALPSFPKSVAVGLSFIVAIWFLTKLLL